MLGESDGNVSKSHPFLQVNSRRSGSPIELCFGFGEGANGVDHAGHVGRLKN